VAAVVPLHLAASELPFVTNFNSGHGRLFYIGGYQMSRAAAELWVVHWGNMSAQDILPSYRYWANAASPFQAHLCHDSAYDGGSSLLLQADAGGAEDDSTTFTLFDVSLTIPTTGTLTVALSTPAAAPNVTVLLAGPSGSPVSFTVAASDIHATLPPDTLLNVPSGWQEFTQDLSANAGFAVASIQIQCSIAAATTSAVAVLVGELRLLGGQTCNTQPEPVAGLTSQNVTVVTNCLGSNLVSMDLLWNAPTDTTVAYNVYQVPSAGSYIFLGRAFTNAWNIRNLDLGSPATSDPNVTLVVQPRNSYGNVQPLGKDTATVTVTL
jgi:hypothetical protein